LEEGASLSSVAAAAAPAAPPPPRRACRPRGAGGGPAQTGADGAAWPGCGPRASQSAGVRRGRLAEADALCGAWQAGRDRLGVAMLVLAQAGARPPPGHF
jgi:hypothetical protein